MSALEKEYDTKKAELQSRMDEDTARVRKRRQQLESIQAEAGGAPAQRMHGADGEAVRRACDTLRQEVAPALAALAEQLGTGTEAWSTVNGLLARLSTSQQVMDKAAEATAQMFDLADGDESYWSESHDLQAGTGGDGAQTGGCDGGDPQLAQQSWQPPQQHHQQGHQWSGHFGTDQGGGGGEAQSWNHWQQSDWAAAPRWRESGHGQWTRTSWADAWESEYCDDADMEEQSEPQSKHRRQGGAAYDSEEQQTGAGGSSFSPTAQACQGPPQVQASDAARQHSEMLSHVVAAAINAGVQPLTTSGEELHVLDAPQLAAWAAENIPSS